jgi:hypothetical protein
MQPGKKMAIVNRVFLLGTVIVWPRRRQQRELGCGAVTALKISTAQDGLHAAHTVFAPGKLGDWCMRMLTPGSVVHIEGELFSLCGQQAGSLIRAFAVQLVSTENKDEAPCGQQALFRQPFCLHPAAASLH